MKKLCLFFLLACLSTVLWSVPAERVLRRLPMADGTWVQARLVGDEHYAWFETPEGRILEETDAGYVFSNDDADAVRATARKARRMAVRRMGSQSSAPLPALGSPRIPVVLVSFSDSVFHVKETDEELLAYYNLYCNGTRDGQHYTAHGSDGAIRDYYEDQSRGAFSPEFVVVGHVRLDNPESTYGRNTSSKKRGSDADFSGFCRDAITKAMSEFDVDWSQFANRGYNRVDMVLFIFAGCGEHNGGASSALWPKWKTLGFQVNGVTFYSGLCSSENRPKMNGDGYVTSVKPEGIGVLCHELNHALGLPDFYDINYKGFGMDVWSIMDYGQYAGNTYTPVAMTAYEREFMGWETMQELTTAGWLTLEPTATTGKGYKIVNPANANEYYIIENRQAVGWDRAVCDFGHGLMVTHVDYDAGKWSGNTVNTDVAHQRMTIIAANNRYLGTCHTELPASEIIKTWNGNLYPFEGNDSLTAYSTPAATVFTAAGFMRKDLNGICENTDGSVSIYFGDGYKTAVGIGEVPQEGLESEGARGIVYDLTGRRLAQPTTKGVYIVDGRKVYVPGQDIRKVIRK